MAHHDSNSGADASAVPGWMPSSEPTTTTCEDGAHADNHNRVPSPPSDHIGEACTTVPCSTVNPGIPVASNDNTTAIEAQSSQSDDHLPFHYSADQLSNLIATKDLRYLEEANGTSGLVSALRTSIARGLSPDLSALDATLVPPAVLHISSAEGPPDSSCDGGGGGSNSPPRGKKGSRLLSLFGRGKAGISATTTIKTNTNKLAAVTMPDGNNDDDDDTPWAKDLQRHCTIFTDRVSQYGVNILPPAKTKSFLQLLLDACKDKFIILLDIAALVSLAIGIYQDVRVTGSPEDNENVHWVEGFAIIVAVAVVVTVGSLNDYQKERQFQKLNAKKDCRKVRVVRNGAEMMIPIQCLMVGDILNIEPGDVLGADAVVIHSSNLKCDESSLTGESDAIKKKSYEDILEERRHMKLSEGSNHDDSLLLHEHHAEPFLLSGSKVIQGVGSCVVVAVGENSFYGKTLLASRREQDPTPLQTKLNKLAGTITKFGSAAAAIMFVALIIKYIVQVTTTDDKSMKEPAKIADSIVNIIIATVTIIVVAVPEGLPLAVTLSLAVATKRMLKDNCFVRLLASCETMGNATAICSDKTGTLTQNRMTVVTGTLGDQYRFSSYPPGIARQQRKLAVQPPVDGLATDAEGQVVNLASEAAHRDTHHHDKMAAFQSKGKGLFLGDDLSGAELDYTSAEDDHYHLTERQHRRVERYRRRKRRRGSITMTSTSASSALPSPGLSPMMSDFSCGAGSSSNFSVLSELTESELDMIPMAELPKEGPQSMMRLIHESIAVNSSAFIPSQDSDGDEGQEGNNDGRIAGVQHPISESKLNPHSSSPSSRDGPALTRRLRSATRRVKDAGHTLVSALPWRRGLRVATDRGKDKHRMGGSDANEVDDTLKPDLDCAFEGSKTEVALMQWSYFMNAPDYRKLREENENQKYVQFWPFSSENKSMSTLLRIKRHEDGKWVWRLYVKGAPEILIKQCRWIVDIDGAFQKQDHDEFTELSSSGHSSSQAMRQPDTTIPALSLDEDGNSDGTTSFANHHAGGSEPYPPVPLLRIESTHSEQPSVSTQQQQQYHEITDVDYHHLSTLDDSHLAVTTARSTAPSDEGSDTVVGNTPATLQSSSSPSGDNLRRAAAADLPADFAENESIPVLPLNNDTLSDLKIETRQYASRALRTIGLAYRDFESLDEDEVKKLESDVEWRKEKGLVWLGLFGIEDPLREGVAASVRKCQMAGITVRMVTGDNPLTARAIATQCGIYTPGMGGIIMEGPKFRKLTPEQLDRVVPKLRVLARSSPEDKRILVEWLRNHKEVVAVTGDGTNDGPALRAADIGFSMGIAGTEVAKEASAIVLMDDNFNSIVRACMWGRCVNDSIKKFLQFQLTVNVTAVLVAFVSAVADKDERAVFSPVQLLWVNLIMDTFAALALATDPPTERLLERLPERRNAPLITFQMWKMIVCQSVYQLVICFMTLYTAYDLFELDRDNDRDVQTVRTLVFNTFVWMQLFNEFNSRALGNAVNVFYNITRNKIFIVVVVFSGVVQVLIVQFGGAAFKTTGGLDIEHWVYSIIGGAFSLVVGFASRFLPDKWFAKVIPKLELDIYHHHEPLSRSGSSFESHSGDIGDEKEVVPKRQTTQDESHTGAFSSEKVTSQ